LALPIHWGETLLQTPSDFQLPYTIYQDWVEERLGRYKKPPPFTKINQNIFVDRKRRTDPHPSICQCDPEQDLGCGPNCINRMLFYECSPKNCPCGDKCTNQIIQKRQMQSKLEVFWSGARGFGLKTKEMLPRDTFIMEYRGEIISSQECLRRMTCSYQNNCHYYFLDYHQGEMLDATTKGSILRFANHSCEPNCRMEKWKINGEYAIVMVADRDIPAGDELVYDYNYSMLTSTDEAPRCLCGSTQCRQVIAAK
ncbi:hypothetical protein BJ085DRAFT_4474, partial [Dimargaris cristalligena]